MLRLKCYDSVWSMDNHAQAHLGFRHCKVLTKANARTPTKWEEGHLVVLCCLPYAIGESLWFELMGIFSPDFRIMVNEDYRQRKHHTFGSHESSTLRPSSISKYLFQSSPLPQLATNAFEAFNKENSFNKNIQPSANLIFCQWVDSVDRVQSIKSTDFKDTPMMAALNKDLNRRGCMEANDNEWKLMITNGSLEPKPPSSIFLLSLSLSLSLSSTHKPFPLQSAILLLIHPLILSFHLINLHSIPPPQQQPRKFKPLLWRCNTIQVQVYHHKASSHSHLSSTY
ncbi:hypothetical protein M5K25_008265 [Dendrobium thyrsiflorum]|uniref:Uncharacterized protein n=1 Tax=Dendrobium thyrsiflorum TaxID=117978 RepID=A0ABD0V813_DENTH